MASELKLSGSAAGRVIVQGNDTITTDQTFTFPDTGGELALNGDIPTVPGGQIVGYQQGTFLPDIKTTGGLSIWMEDGVSRGPNIQAGANFDWWRNGQTVTINTYFKVGSAGNSGDDQTLIVTNLPYKAKDAPSSNTGPFYIGTAIPSLLLGGSSSHTTLTPFIQSIAGDSTEIKGGYSFYFILSVLGSTVNTSLKGQNIANGGAIYAQLTYQTDDTTWTPKNGATVS